ncbi:MAG: sialidase family protein, partial [Bacillota bacterium]|nr:sialidase family protein [Bacillota bacterium]
QGRTFSLRGGADVPDRSFDEHMVLEQQDGRLRMLVRTHYGIGQSFSEDSGQTWSAGADAGLGGPCSRFFIGRLRSGRVLLVNHVAFKGRNNLTVLLSDDDGRTWPYQLLLDERDHVSYPDATETDDGRILIAYDRERYAAREILMATVTEEDIKAGHCVSGQCKLKSVINQASG